MSKGLRTSGWLLVCAGLLILGGSTWFIAVHGLTYDFVQPLGVLMGLGILAVIVPLVERRRGQR